MLAGPRIAGRPSLTRLGATVWFPKGARLRSAARHSRDPHILQTKCSSSPSQRQRQLSITRTSTYQQQILAGATPLSDIFRELSVLDQYVSFFALVSSRTPFHRNVAKRLLMLDVETGAGFTSPNTLEDGIYLSFRRYSRKMYVGQSSNATYMRWMGHVRSSISGNSNYYVNNRKDFHRFVYSKYITSFSSLRQHKMCHH